MCLIVDKCNALTAEEDIICYKVYMYCKPKDEYKSPFQLCRIKKFNKVIHVPKFLDPIEENQVHFGFHTFCDEKSAKYFAELFSYKVFKCIIPKGSKYYKGITYVTSERYTLGYCSEALIVLFDNISDNISLSPLGKLKKLLTNLFFNL